MKNVNPNIIDEKDVLQFQRIFTQKNGKLSGPMSPALAVQYFCEYMEMKFDGAARWCRSENLTYDHLIIRKKYKNCTFFCMIIDKGSSIIPVGMWYDNDPKVTITPAYRKSITPGNIHYERENMEHPGTTENPIAVLDENSLKTLFIKAGQNGKLDIINI